MADDGSAGPKDEQLSVAVVGALNVLLGDHRRRGKLGVEDVARIAEKRNLDLDQLHSLLSALNRRGIVAHDDQQDLPSHLSNAAARAGKASHRLLSAEDERRLANIMRLANRLADPEEGGTSAEVLRFKAEGAKARDELITRNIDLVRWVAKGFRGSGLEFEDLVQEGTKGLIRAVEMFDPDLGYRFSTYATWWIRQSIRRGIDDTANTIRIPVHRLDSIRVLRRMRRRLRAELGTDPPLGRLAAALDWSIEKAVFISQLAELRPIELDAPITDETYKTLESILLHDTHPTPEEAAVIADLRENVKEALATLPPRMRDVMRRRFGLDDGIPRTLEEIARKYRITRERIRQIEAQALKMLRHPTRRRRLKTFIE